MSVRAIARLARLSPSTVSLALRNSPKIPDDTRRRVRRLAKRIGYQPNAKITELMSQVRSSRNLRSEACFGVISFYDSACPWEKSQHLSRIYEGMAARAGALGYRLEPLWLRAPGMTYRRFRSILDARGIEGLLCFGSPDINEEFPPEFDHYAVVSQILEKTPFSGLEENQGLIGAWAVELLVARIMNRDFGIPANPRIEMVERRWVNGQSLRQQRP